MFRNIVFFRDVEIKHGFKWIFLTYSEFYKEFTCGNIVYFPHLFMKFVGFLQFEVINGIGARIIGGASSSSYYFMDSQFGHRGLHKKQKPTIFSFQLCIFCGCHFNSFLFSLIDFVLCVPFRMTSSSFKRHTTQVGSAASINWCKNTIMINCWNLCKLQAF